MLTDDEFHEYCTRLGLAPAAVELIQKVRSSGPSRRVGGGNRAGCALYPSRKMGFGIQAESINCELIFIRQCEHDDNVLELYDQPGMIWLECKTAGGRPNPRCHYPDFLILARHWAGWVECKTENELARREQKGDQQFIRGDDGGWISPQGGDYAARFGLVYRVWTDSKVNWVEHRNLNYLESYFRDVRFNLDAVAKKEVLLAVKKREGVPVSERLKLLTVATVDTVNAMIAREDIYVDLGRAPLVKPEAVSVYSSCSVAEAFATSIVCADVPLPISKLRVTAQPGSRLSWGDTSYAVVNTQTDPLTIVSDQGIPAHISKEALERLVLQGEVTWLGGGGVPNADERVPEPLGSSSPKDMEAAMRRYHVLFPSSGAPSVDASERSKRRWRSYFRQAHDSKGNGFWGLFDQSRARGNRRRKMMPDTLEATQRFIEEMYERPKQQKLREVHSMLAVHCEEHDIKPPSYATFRSEAKARNRATQVRKRQGERAAYQVESYNDKPQGQLPRHGDRPFEIAHLDHTEADIELIHSVTKENLGRPHVTMLTDAFSRRILAVYCTYDPPSAASCMMALVECVHRHNRLPESIVTDWGPEFGSIYYETLLAAYGITKKSRPPASPRYGSTAEKTFGTMNTQCVHNLQGNTQIMTDVRQVTASVDPKRLAVWTLADFDAALCEWAYSVYDQLSQSGLGMSPREAFRLGMEKYGDRPHTLIPFDQTFYYLTLPSTRKGVAKIDPQKGVKIHYIYYYCPAFGRPENAGKSVPVRYDPFDLNAAYAYIDHHWESLQTQGRESFMHRSCREIAIAAREIRAQHRAQGRKYVTLDANTLGAYIVSNESKELMLIRDRDSEIRKVNSRVRGEVVERGPLVSPDDGLGPSDGAPAGDGYQVPVWVVREAPPEDFNLDDLPPLEDYD